MPSHSLYSRTMSDFLEGISLGLSPEDPFHEDMEVECLTSQEGNVAPRSPSNALRDLATDQWPSQAPEDQLLRASQLVQELSDRSSSGEEDENAGVYILPGPLILSPPHREL